MSLSSCLLPFSQSATALSSSACSCHLAASFSHFPVSSRDYSFSRNESLVLNGGGSNLCRRFCGLKLWILKSLNARQCSHRKHQPVLKKGDVDEYEIRIVIGADGPRSPKDGSSATPLAMLKEIEQGRNTTKLLTNRSLVAA